MVALVATTIHVRERNSHLRLQTDNRLHTTRTFHFPVFADKFIAQAPHAVLIGEGTGSIGCVEISNVGPGCTSNIANAPETGGRDANLRETWFYFPSVTPNY